MVILIEALLVLSLPMVRNLVPAAVMGEWCTIAATLSVARCMRKAPIGHFLCLVAIHRSDVR